MHKLEPLLRMLADGRFHSGAALGKSMGIGRSAVWKQIRAAEAMGLDIHAVRGKGYRLAAPLELLERAAIVAGLKSRQAGALGGIEIHFSIDSTNRYLMQRAADGLQGPFICLSEFQSAGRGRRGRSWTSPFGRNLYLSLLWDFDLGADALPALSLAAGVAVAEALEQTGVTGMGVKWPNDLYHGGRKLGGILIELAGEASGPFSAVVGVGINVDMRDLSDPDIDQPWTDLRSALGRRPERNSLAARIIDALLDAMPEFEREGFSPFRDSYQRFDITRGREVELHQGPGRFKRGRSLGVGDQGALLLQSDGGVSTVVSGEVSLRISQ
ncbi:MAG: bifunctional biotin--[acetyl-CoA-carboxylase] ligase/biotin operon repressor BirA [Gammaproteobacteria bacterium]|nr:bifunctional biotin--[acetyl-CoA-carboxylase] ligase/biotin operon repressor BirA [Gammaproteobacteria bacterium]